MKTSAGILLYRPFEDGDIEVLLVRPSGLHRSGGPKPWSLPKGLPDPGETLEQAARRETWEEAGVKAADLFPLGSIQYTTKSRKIVHAWGGLIPDDADPHCASWEVDRVAFLSVDEAHSVLHRDQRPFVDRLVEYLTEDLDGFRNAEREVG
ncbi:Diadenosine hexaphosphate hydrolase [Planctomycetes bacterium Pan216]|uniref:Diadenosine hexaphosphate hydrolase n=1 Tax=Kolteria novifilia TaxID=2527975 RepID=A0A518BBV4_9BACT|nr:Diadenosine hexaphosphate hydrolase [Planctomycetes bacterium Pan216]